MPDQTKASIAKIKKETKSLTSKALKNYQERVQANIKELEIAILTLEADQKHLNAINTVIKKELDSRNDPMYVLN